MLVAAVFRLPRLGFPAEEVFDEVYHAKTALQYLQGENPTEWVHPPTAKLLIAIGVWLFGLQALGLAAAARLRRASRWPRSSTTSRGGRWPARGPAIRGHHRAFSATACTSCRAGSR
jgi:dolichyl-phosphate-mannose--protein O-mannosyl transferase